MLAAALGAGSGSAAAGSGGGSGPSTPSGGAQGGGANALAGGVSAKDSMLFTGTFLKAGDDNSRWKRRYFQLVSIQQPSAPRILKLQYFENDKDAARNRQPRGELLIENVMGLAVLGRLPQADPAVASCVSLTSDHVQEGPLKLIIWGRDRLWRLCEQSNENSSTSSELIRSLDRCRVIPKIALRAVGWMRSQGTLSWNRRYAMLFSTGDLLIFKDATLEHLRRRIDLARVMEIRPLQPLAPAGSQTEKKVLRMLAFTGGGSWDEGNLEALELVGIRLRHPDITEKRGYVMCVEMSPSTGEYDAAVHYERFRKWLVQLQLSAAEARLSGYSSSRDGGKPASQQQQQQLSANVTSLEDDEASLERKLLHVVQLSAHANASREGALNVAVPFLSLHGSFPALWRSSLWYVLSGGASLKKNLGTRYSSLIIRDSSQAISERTRLLSALLRLDSNLAVDDVLSLIDLFLQFGGEENSFWTLASITCSLTASSPLTSLQAFFHSGFARYVEARVVLDLLALKHPNVIAHISAYDLTTELIERCAAFISRCNIAVIWDAVTVWGKDAMAYALVMLLSAKRDEIIQCFGSDDLKKCLESFKDVPEDAAFWQWQYFDAKVVDQVRRAQWTTLVESLRGHANLVGSWRSLADESKSFGSKLNQQLNRLLNNGWSPAQEPVVSPLGSLSRSGSNESVGSRPSYSGEIAGISLGHLSHLGKSPKDDESTVDSDEESDEIDDWIDLIHQNSVSVISTSSKLFELAGVTEAALDSEMLQTTTGSSAKQSNGNTSTDNKQPTMSPAKTKAVSLVPLVEGLFEAILRLGWMCMASAWKSWCRANLLAYQHTRFVPRACIGVSKVTLSPHPPALQGGGLTVEASSLSVVSSATFTTGKSSANAPGVASREGSALGQPLVAVPPGALLEDSPPLVSSTGADGSSLKSLAIGIGKRFFHQRFLNNAPVSGQQGGDIREKKALNSSNVQGKGIYERAIQMPENGQLTADSALALLLKFRGGFVGLCEQAGGITDVELVREAMLRDQRLMRALDETNVFLFAALHCGRLARWVFNKEPLAPIADVPEAFKHLFIPQQVVFNKEGLHSLEKALEELSNRTLGTTT